MLSYTSGKRISITRRRTLSFSFGFITEDTFSVKKSQIRPYSCKKKIKKNMIDAQLWYQNSVYLWDWFKYHLTVKCNEFSPTLCIIQLQMMTAFRRIHITFQVLNAFFRKQNFVDHFDKITNPTTSLKKK